MRMIDADALKEYIDAQKGRPFIGCTIGEALKMMVDEQPTAEERKIGKWIKKDCDLLYCSECDLPSLHPWPYCERCGAKMGEKSD